MQAWKAIMDEGGRGGTLPLDKHSLDRVISHSVPFGILWLGNHLQSHTFST